LARLDPQLTDLADELPGSSDSGNSVWRVLLVVLLILVTLTAAIPLRVWRQQMGWLLMLSFLCCSGAISPDGLGVDYQPRLPTDRPQPLRLPIRTVPTRASYGYSPLPDAGDHCSTLFYPDLQHNLYLLDC